MKLSERAMLATLRVSTWSGMSLDKNVSDEVAETHKAGKDAGRYNKRIVATRFLARVNQKINNARQTHKLLTLPWEDDGTRILSVTGYEAYTQGIKRCIAEVDEAADDFVQHLPSYIDEAQSRLGDMFNAEDYPLADEVRSKFNVDVEFKSVPESGDFRAQLTTEAVDAITKDIEYRCNSRVELAMKDVYQRIADVSEKMSERLNAYEEATIDPATKKISNGAKNLFRDTLVTNVKELVDLIPTLNITGDPKLTALAKELETDLVENPPDILRSDAKARRVTADAADRIFKKAKQFLA